MENREYSRTITGSPGTPSKVARLHNKRLFSPTHTKVIHKARPGFSPVRSNLRGTFNGYGAALGSQSVCSSSSTPSTSRTISSSVLSSFVNQALQSGNDNTASSSITGSPEKSSNSIVTGLNSTPSKGKVKHKVKVSHSCTQTGLIGRG